MSEVRASNTWRDELASLVDDTGIRYAGHAGDPIGISTSAVETTKLQFVSGALTKDELVESESFKDQAKEFAKAWGEMLLELGRGCRDIVVQNLATEDSFIAQKVGKPLGKISGRLRFLNEYLPEDRDPVHAWPVIFFVFLLAFAGEPFIDGNVIPYEESYHAEWMRERKDDRFRNKICSRKFRRRSLELTG